MGDYWSKLGPDWSAQEVVAKNIYIYDQQNRCYPVIWFRTYEDLIHHLYTHFQFTPMDQDLEAPGVNRLGTLIFTDATEVPVYVNSEASYQGLVPRRDLTDENVKIYHVGLHLNGQLALK